MKANGAGRRRHQVVEYNEIKKKSKLVADDYRRIFGENLVSVILYGSAGTPEYIPKKSDLNFLIVLSEEGIEQLNLAHELAAKWHKKKVSTPLFLTKDYIESSLDTFPIEFLNIKRNYKVVLGEDVLAELSFNKEFVRMQCERELKGKLLLLREKYVETRGRARVLKNLIAASVPTCVFVFKALLYLLDKEVPATKHETISVLARELNIDEGLFLTLLKIRERVLKPPAKEIDGMFQAYLKEMRNLALLMDKEDFGISPGQAG
jgi:hypothetical protein